MAYGKLKVDTITYDNSGSDTDVPVSTLAAAANAAPINSPTFTGVPAAPTAGSGTNTTQIATTAFVATAVTSKANIASPSFTGIPIVTGDGSSADGQIQLNCSQNSHGVKIKSPPHSANASYTLTLPNNTGTNGYALTTDGSGVTSWAASFSAGSANTFTALQTLNAGVDLSGLLVEEFRNTGSFSSDTNVNLADGMLHRYSTTENYTQSPNIRFNASTSLNSVMSAGQAVTVTIIVAATAGRWMPSLTIDGAAAGGLNWVGGAAPSAGGTSGNDIYTYNILKTANGSFIVIASFAKTS